MAQFPYRANLSAAIFPMTIARAGRSVIVPQADQNFNRSVDSPDDSNRDAGIPQIIYGENILPTADGYQSIGYVSRAAGFTSAAENQDVKAFVPYLGLTLEVDLQVSAGGIFCSVGGGVWYAATIVGLWTVDSLQEVSTATVRGVCYLYSDHNLYTVENLAGVITVTNITASVLPVGLLTNVVAMTGSYNYLLLASKDTLYWSSTTTPTDFTPSLISGAGSGRVNGAFGNIKYMRAATFGAFIYCESNVVSASYTGNARYPWKQIPISRSEGAASWKQIAATGTDRFSYFITNAGTLQILDQNEATNVAPEVTELVERLQYVDVFNPATNTFTVARRAGDLYYFKLAYVNNRYLIVSIRESAGTTPYTHAIVYDSTFKRYGKINLDHTAIIEQPYLANGLHTIVLLNSVTGEHYTLSQNVNDPAIVHSGVLLLGKFQYVRSRWLCLDEISVESAQLPELVDAADRNFSVHTITTLDGKTFQPAVEPYLVANGTTGAVQTYNSSAEGKNVSLLFKGNFDLCSVDLLFHLGGE